jgi:hypothetical protein
MTAFEDLRDDTLAVYTSLTGVLAPRLGPTRTRLLAESRDKLAAGQLVVVVCGEFNGAAVQPAQRAGGAASPVPDRRRYRYLSRDDALGPGDAATVYFAGPLRKADLPAAAGVEVSGRRVRLRQGNPRNAKAC